jgi:MarR family transcriptional regulator, lower aerobic nicotinate degradation pathway regulator
MEIDHAPKRLRALPSWLLAQSAIAARRFVASALSELNAGRSEYAMLACLDEFGPLSQAQLSERTGLDRSDVVRLVDSLAANGHALRTTDPGDRRRNIITLTEPGRGRLLELDAVLTRAQALAMARLTSDEQAELTSLLHRMLGA